jgi:hypothetical protein
MTNYRYDPQRSVPVPLTQPVVRTLVKRPAILYNRSKPICQKKARTQVPLRTIDDSDAVVEVTQGSSRGTKEEWDALLPMSVPQVSNDSVKVTGCLPDTEEGETKASPESPPARH